MKMNDEVANVSQDAALVTSKATEFFIADLIEASQQICVANKRKTIKVRTLCTSKLYISYLKLLKIEIVCIHVLFLLLNGNNEWWASFLHAII